MPDSDAEVWEFTRQILGSLSPADQAEYEEARRERRRYTAVCRDNRWFLRDHAEFNTLPFKDYLLPSHQRPKWAAEQLANWLNAEVLARSRGQHSELPENLFRMLGDHPELREVFLTFQDERHFGVSDIKERTYLKPSF